MSKKKSESFINQIIWYAFLAYLAFEALKFIVTVVIPAILMFIAKVIGFAILIAIGIGALFLLFKAFSFIYKRKISPLLKQLIRKKREKTWGSIPIGKSYEKIKSLKLNLETKSNELMRFVKGNEDFLKECELILKLPVLHTPTRKKAQSAIADLTEENAIFLSITASLEGALKDVSKEEIRIANEKSYFLENGKRKNHSYDPGKLIQNNENLLLHAELKLKEQHATNSYHDIDKTIFFEQLYEESRNPRHPDPHYLENNPLTDEQKVDQEDRLKQANTLCNQIPPKYAEALSLYNPDIDFEHTGWLLRVGWIFDLHYNNNPVFDPELSFQFFVEASRLGSREASYNIALKYSSGKESPINVNAAAYWLKKATEQSDPDSEYMLASLYENNDGRFWRSKEEDFKSHVYQLIENSFGKGSLYAMVKRASLLSTGRYLERNSDAVIELYNKIIVKEPAYHEEYSKYLICLKFALRLILGFDVEQNFKKAQEILGLIPEKSNQTDVRFTLNNYSSKLKDIISEYLTDEQPHNNALIAVQDLYYRKSNHQDFRKSIIENQVDSLNEAIKILWCVWTLASYEEWLDRFDWLETLGEAQAKYMGLKYEDIVASTFFMGPRYNPLSDNGLPVLGVWEKPSKDIEEVEEDLSRTGSYVPEAGVVKFKGLQTDNEGRIIFDFIKASDSPALLVPEDFEVALALVFGDENGPITPYLSLENPNRHKIEDRFQVFKFKEWKPAWLGYTDFGRTLYITDQWIGAFCWNPREFDIGNPEATFDRDVSEYAFNLMEDIAMTGGRSGEGEARRVMLRPENISIPTPVKISENSYYIAVEEVKMRVDGDYVIRGEGRDKDLHLKLNDDLYKQGRTVNKLSDRYYDIASMAPIYARSAELMGLLHSLIILRNQTDFRINENILTRIRKKYQYFEELSPLPLYEQLCIHLPSKYKRI